MTRTEAIRKSAVSSFLIVTGDFVTTGGMDRANFALADYLSRRGHEVHLVTHRAEEGLLRQSRVIAHRVPRLAGSHFLSTPLLDRVGRFWAARIARQGGRVVVNGSNCLFGDVNWVHYVHAAYAPCEGGGRLARRWLSAGRHAVHLRQERERLRQARVLIANSERTRRDLIERLGFPEQRVIQINYGVDATLFRPAKPDERKELRGKLGWLQDRPVVVFVGAVRDPRKGFDTLLAAWDNLCNRPGWDADLVVAGSASGAKDLLRSRKTSAINGRIHFLGLRSDIATVLRACDLLVSPTRYEAYGLAVHEALCCGLPALVSANAGVAERYPSELEELLLPDPEDAVDLACRLWEWRGAAARHSMSATKLSVQLRAYTWDHMAAEIVERIGSTS
jgi:glycosyltransferase involved in cell wall biosynthesis